MHAANEQVNQLEERITELNVYAAQQLSEGFAVALEQVACLSEMSIFKEVKDGKLVNVCDEGGAEVEENMMETEKGDGLAIVDEQGNAEEIGGENGEEDGGNKVAEEDTAENHETNPWICDIRVMTQLVEDHEPILYLTFILLS